MLIYLVDQLVYGADKKKSNQKTSESKMSSVVGLAYVEFWIRLKASRLFSVWIPDLLQSLNIFKFFKF